MKCKAIRDGLLGTSYVHEGEFFLAEKCPSWAVPAGTVKQRAKASKGEPSEPEEQPAADDAVGGAEGV